MNRFAVVFLPAFRLERCGWSEDDLAVLAAEEKNALRLQAMTPAAASQGLRRGMSVSEARAVVPVLAIELLDEEGERADQREMVHAFACLSDRVQRFGHDAVCLEISGVSHLHGGEEGLVQAIISLSDKLGHRCRVAISDHPLVSGALARFGRAPHCCVPSGPATTAAALAPLPLLALEPSDELLRSMEAVGVEHVGPFARIDRASIAGRFGDHGVALHRLAHGVADAGRPWDDPDEEPDYVERAVLGGPTVNLQPLFFLLPGILTRLVARMADKADAVVRLAVRLLLEEGHPRVLRVRVGRPTRDVEVLERLIRARLEGLRLPCPATELVLQVEEAAPEVPWQPSFTDRTDGSETMPDLLLRMSDVLGEGALVMATLHDVWKPEKAWSPTPFQMRPRLFRRRRVGRGPSKPDPVDALVACELVLQPPRPTLLLPEPEPLEVRAQHDVPEAIRERGRWRLVERCQGPERLQGAWWSDEESFNRDYWVITLGDGAESWIYREGGAWYLHGRFD